MTTFVGIWLICLLYLLNRIRKDHGLTSAILAGVLVIAIPLVFPFVAGSLIMMFQ